MCHRSENCQIFALMNGVSQRIGFSGVQYDGQVILISELYDHVTLIYLVLCGISKCWKEFESICYLCCDVCTFLTDKIWKDWKYFIYSPLDR